MKNVRGFSLVELLIVVMILGIIMSIAIPALLASRRAANEAAAMGNLRTLDNAQSAYLAQTGKSGFLTNLRSSSFLDSAWTSGVYRTGFLYNEVTILPSAGQYYFTALPSSSGNGFRSFTLIEDHVVRYTQGIVVLPRGSGNPVGT